MKDSSTEAWKVTLDLFMDDQIKSLIQSNFLACGCISTAPFVKNLHKLIPAFEPNNLVSLFFIHVTHDNKVKFAKR